MAEMQTMVNTNFVGLVECAKQAFQSMHAHKTEGTIININSVAGQLDLPLTAVGVYAATKHAVTSITKSLRSEAIMLKANIRVTSLSPGATKSEMTDQFFDDNKGIDEVLVMLPAKDIADCVLFILQSPQRMTISEMTVHPTSETILGFALAAATMAQEHK